MHNHTIQSKDDSVRSFHIFSFTPIFNRRAEQLLFRNVGSESDHRREYKKNDKHDEAWRLSGRPKTWSLNPNSRHS